MVPLTEMHDVRVAPHAPDVRGWPAVLPDGTLVGTVTDLMVDRAVGRVRYVEMALSDAPDGETRYVLVPIGTAQVDAAHDRVIVPAATLLSVADRIQYERGVVTRQYETSLRRQVLGIESDRQRAADAAAEDAAEHEVADREAAERERERRAASAADDDFYAHESYDERRFVAARRGEHARDEDFSYLVGVGGAMTGRDTHPEPVADLGAGQIRVPLMEEEGGPPP